MTELSRHDMLPQSTNIFASHKGSSQKKVTSNVILFICLFYFVGTIVSLFVLITKAHFIKQFFFLVKLSSCLALALSTNFTSIIANHFDKSTTALLKVHLYNISPSLWSSSYFQLSYFHCIHYKSINPFGTFFRNQLCYRLPFL